MPYRLSALAEQDLDEIWSYVAEDASPATADRLIDASSTDSSYWPNSPYGSPAAEFGEGVRSFVVESYVIYYRQDVDVLSPEFSTAGAIKLLHGSELSADRARLPDGSRAACG